MAVTTVAGEIRTMTKTRITLISQKEGRQTLMPKDNTSAVVFGNMKEDIDTVKGDLNGLKQRVEVLEEQPAGGRSSSPSVCSNSLYSMFAMR